MKHPLRKYSVECGAFTATLALPPRRVEQAESGNKEAREALVKKVTEHLGALGVLKKSTVITYGKLTIHEK